MASCININPDGTLYQTGEAMADCSGYVLLDAVEYTDLPTLQSIFAMPVAEDVAKLWVTGFSLPLVVYLVAWGFGVVINWFKPEHENC